MPVAVRTRTAAARRRARIATEPASPNREHGPIASTCWLTVPQQAVARSRDTPSLCRRFTRHSPTLTREVTGRAGMKRNSGDAATSRTLRLRYGRHAARPDPANARLLHQTVPVSRSMRLALSTTDHTDGHHFYPRLWRLDGFQRHHLPAHRSGV